MAKKTSKQEQHDKWTDMLGQDYWVGDQVAVPYLSGRNLAMAVGVVEQINSTTVDGTPLLNRVHSKGKFFEEPSCTVTVLVTHRSERGLAPSRHTYRNPEKIILYKRGEESERRRATTSAAVREELLDLANNL